MATTTTNQSEPPKESPIKKAWLNLVESLKRLLVPRKDNRPMDQYLEFRDKVLEIVQSEKFLAELATAYDDGEGGNSKIDQNLKGALLLELQAFPRTFEVVQKTEKGKAKKRWLDWLLNKASTVTGSVKDILAENNPFLKGALTLLEEAIDFFKKD